MSGASSFSPPKRVAVQIRHRESAGYRIRFGERAGDRRSLDSLQGPAFSIVYNLPAPFFPSVASRIIPGNGRLLTTRIERTRTQRALLVVSAFLPTRRDIRSGIVNWGRRQITAGKCFSFLRSLVQHPQKSGRSVFHALFFAPVLSFVPIHHAAEKSMEKALCRPEKIRISSRKIT